MGNNVQSGTDHNHHPKEKEKKEENDDHNMIFSSDQKKVNTDDFTLLKLIGKGNFASVYQVRKKDNGKIYAMKILSKTKLKKTNQLDHIKTERVILEYADFPFLVSLVYAFQTEDKLYMVMDFVNGGEMFFHLKKQRNFDEKRAKFYAAEIFLALTHLHKQNIIYRDLKPENILMDAEGHVLLTDFGLCKILTTEERTHTFCGTPEYLAPEVILQKGHGKAVDWWAFGILLYEMMVGIPPFYCQNVQEMYDKILYSDVLFPEEMSNEACDLILRLLERDPVKRLGSGTKGSNEIKNHVFFKDIDFDKMMNKEVPPPYKPKVEGPLDTSYFDDEFTKQSVKDSPSKGSKLNPTDQEAFEGFTFTGEKEFSVKSDNLSVSFTSPHSPTPREEK